MSKGEFYCAECGREDGQSGFCPICNTPLESLSGEIGQGLERNRMGYKNPDAYSAEDLAEEENAKALKNNQVEEEDYESSFNI